MRYSVAAETHMEESNKSIVDKIKNRHFGSNLMIRVSRYLDIFYLFI